MYATAPNNKRVILTGTAIAALVLVCAASTPAQAQIVLNFDALSGMSNSPGAAVPLASRISDQFSSSGVVFSSGSGASFITAVNLGVGHATSGGTGVGGATAAGDLTYAGDPLFIARFVNPANGTTPFVTNFVSVRGDLNPAGANITLRAYNIANALLGEVTLPDTGGTTLSLSLAGINRVEITGTGNVAYDDFTFNNVTAPVTSAAPEPTSLALLMPLFPVAGAIARRRRALNQAKRPDSA